MEQKVRQVLSLNLMQDGTTCMDVAMEVDGKPEIWHIPGGPVTVEEQEEPIDLAQKAAEKGNPWFGLGHTLVPKREVTELGVLSLADIRALHERLFTMAQGNPDYMILSPYQAANWERWERRLRHSVPRERSKRHRAERWQKIRRRQRRAAQRRHARGEG